MKLLVSQESSDTLTDFTKVSEVEVVKGWRQWMKTAAQTSTLEVIWHGDARTGC